MRRRSRFTLAISTIALLLAAWWAAPAVRQTPPRDAHLSVEALRADLDAWEVAVRTRHPRWHGREDDPDLARAFEEARAKVSRPMSREDAFRAFSRLNPQFRDAHALLMPTSVAPAHGDAALFPFDVRIDGNHLLLRRQWRRTADGLELAAGSSIAAINGEPTPALLEKLDAHGHGETPGLRRAMLGVLFGDWLHAIFGWSDRFSLSIDGHSKPVELGVDDQWVADVSDTERWAPHLAPLDGAVAWMKVPTFDIDSDPAAFNTAVDAIFATLRHERVKGLVIDVRGNTGGQSEAGGRVASHLTSAPILPASRAMERLHADNSGWMDWRGAPGTLREIAVDEDAEIAPSEGSTRFQGRVVLLVDGMTYSAAIVFATTLQDHGLATLVGSPTGGFGNQTGNMEPFLLPNSGFLAYVPAREFIRPNGDERLLAVMPDVVVPTSGQVNDEALEIARRIAAGDSINRAEP